MPPKSKPAKKKASPFARKKCYRCGEQATRGPLPKGHKPDAKSPIYACWCVPHCVNCQRDEGQWTDGICTTCITQSKCDYCRINPAVVWDKDASVLHCASCPVKCNVCADPVCGRIDDDDGSVRWRCTCSEQIVRWIHTGGTLKSMPPSEDVSNPIAGVVGDQQ